MKIAQIGTVILPKACTCCGTVYETLPCVGIFNDMGLWFRCTRCMTTMLVPTSETREKMEQDPSKAAS